MFLADMTILHTQRPWIGGIVESRHHLFIIQYVVTIFSDSLADYLRDENTITPISARKSNESALWGAIFLNDVHFVQVQTG